MKNSGFEAWRSRLDYFSKEFPFGQMQTFRNEDGRLHRDDGPAYISPTRIAHYINGRRHGIDADKHGSITYYYENIRVPPHYCTKPEALTIDDVLSHPNAEVRYVGMRIIGLEKVMADKRTRIIDSDESKGMVLFQFDGGLSEPVSYLKVVNSTMEPDGSFKNYYLCVPPNMKKCKQAVAWTFGLNASDYNPTQET